MITASVVLYRNDPSVFEPAIVSFLEDCNNGVIWISDNSPEPIQSTTFNRDRTNYFNNEKNLGFGGGHNIALAKIPSDSEFHLFLNPDIKFSKGTLPELIRLMRADDRIGAIMPRIVYPNGSIQYLAKLLPTPLDLIIRRFIPFEKIKNLIDSRYELRDLHVDFPVEVPAISGCFLLVRTGVLREIGGFDEQFFMYMEDFDLIRRIAQSHKVVYAPNSEVMHHYAKGSYVNKTLLLYHIKSAIRYFNKWGWVFDATRRSTNRKVLNFIRSPENRFRRENMS